MAENALGYEFLDHTADIGLRATGATLCELFIHAAQGLTALIAEDSTLKPTQIRAVQLSAPDVESLFLAWLQELLFWFSSERFLPVEYRLESVMPTGLRGQVSGDTFDPTRHAQGREVKAVTRHQLTVAQEAGGWRAQVLFDI